MSRVSLLAATSPQYPERAPGGVDPKRANLAQNQPQSLDLLFIFLSFGFRLLAESNCAQISPANPTPEGWPTARAGHQSLPG
jgi:hypothetical protein